MGWTIGRLRLSTFPPKVHSGPLRINILFFRNRSVSYFRIGQLYSRVIFISRNSESIFPLLFSTTFPRLYFGWSVLAFLRFSVVARKLSMTGSVRIFEKLHFNLKLRRSHFSRSKFQNDRLAHNPGTQDRSPHCVLPSASESPEC